MTPEDFIDKRYGQKEIAKAQKAQKDLRQLIVSEVQEKYGYQDIQVWCENISKKDTMLEWVNYVFQSDSYQSFAKYLRYPFVSSTLIHEEIIPQLKRVFFSDDSYNVYKKDGEKIDVDFETQELYEDFLHYYVFNYNDVVLHDKDENNKVIRKLVSINDVLAMEATRRDVVRIAIKACIYNENTGKEDVVILYVDDKFYITYDYETGRELSRSEHKQGYTPVTFVSKDAFNDKFIIRNGKLTRLRTQLEEYLFYSTLQKMVDPNGAIPVIVKFASENKEEEVKYDDNSNFNYPMSSFYYSRHSKKKGNNAVQAGTIHEVPVLRNKQNGSIEKDLVKNYMEFFRHPVDSLKYIQERIDVIKRDIIVTIIGDYAEPQNQAQNELQVSKSYISKQDRYRDLSENISWAVQKSNKFYLGLSHGYDNVYVANQLGTDFFIETQTELLEEFNLAPNQIERFNILERMSKNRNKTNEERRVRELVLLAIIPYASDKDFDYAISNGIATREEKTLQLKYHDVIIAFEAQMGSISGLYMGMANTDLTEQQKIQIIKEQINNYFKQNYLENDVKEGDNQDGATEDL